MGKVVATGENTVLVDMDGVLADFEEPNNEILRRHFPEIVPVIDRPDFYFNDTYESYDGVNDRIYAENRRPGFFRAFPVVDGAIQGWQRILEAGYVPRVCSSPLEDHNTVVAEKIAWLEEYFVPEFGAWVVDLAIFNRDKSSYDAVAMIDDRPTLRSIEKAAWQHVIFSRSYNREVETDFRLENWFDPELEDMLLRAKEKYLSIVKQT
jgi:5'-nucleotidase